MCEGEPGEEASTVHLLILCTCTNPTRYCSHMVTDEINSVVELLLQDLVRFQDRQHLRDPVRTKSKRRYVCGLREVCKHLGLGKLKCVIIPPNLDHIQSTGTMYMYIVCTYCTCACKYFVHIHIHVQTCHLYQCVGRESN